MANLFQLITAIGSGFNGLNNKADKILEALKPIPAIAGGVADIQARIGQDQGEPAGPAVVGRIFVGNFPGQTIQLVGESMLILTDTQKVALAVAWADAKGVAVTLPAPASWASSDPTAIASVTASADGTSAVVVAGTPAPGGSTVQISANGANADGTAVAATFDITVMPGDAVTGNITAGTPEAA